MNNQRHSCKLNLTRTSDNDNTTTASASVQCINIIALYINDITFIFGIYTNDDLIHKSYIYE